jgi:hypothetical protein
VSWSSSSFFSLHFVPIIFPLGRNCNLELSFLELILKYILVHVIFSGMLKVNPD